MNCTSANPRCRPQIALTDTLAPDTVALFAGAVTDTVGGVVSGGGGGAVPPTGLSRSRTTSAALSPRL